MTARSGLLLAASAVLLQAGRPSANDWPQFRGPRGDGTALDRGIRKDWSVRPPQVRWRVALGDDGYAGPSAAQGRVFIVDHDGDRDIVRALRLSDGSEIWRTAYADASNHSYGFARATPTVFAGRLYTLSREGRLHCLDVTNGKIVWRRSLTEEFAGKPPMWGYTAPPFVDRGAVVVCPGGKDAAIVRLDPATGETRWKGGEGDVPGYGMPVVTTLAGKRQYVMTVWTGFVGIDTESGRVLWRFPWETRDGTNVADPIPADGGVFISSSYDMGCALLDIDAAGARPRWQNKEIRAHFNTPVLHNGFLYGTGDPGYLVCLDARTGAARWKQSGFEKGGVVAVDGVLLAVNGSRGDVVMVRLSPERYEELGRFTPLGGQSWSPPVVAQGKLLIRNRKELACVDLR